MGHAAREPLMPPYALLQSDRPKRLSRWEHFTRNGGRISLQALGRRPVTTRADTSEPVPRPLAIEWLFGSDGVHLCHDRGVETEYDEEPVRNPSKLENRSTH